MTKSISLFFLILLCGCELTLNVDVPHDKESLVINSIFAADSLWQVSVSYDRAILDDGPFKLAKDAEVVLYDESGPVETLKPDTLGVYHAATSRPLPGRRYEVHVSSPGHDPVSANAYIPIATEIVNVKTRETLIDEHPATAFDITINDDPAVANYYRVFVEIGSFIIKENERPVAFYSPTYVESDDPLLADESNLSEDGVLIRDALFNGKEAKLSVRMRNGFYFGPFKVRINVQTLSKEAYDYFITAQLQANTSDDPLAQPVKVFNNIEGGFGIFAGYNQSIYYLDGQPDLVITSITPMSGHVNDEIIIEGANLGGSIRENIILFSGRGLPRAQPLEATSTRIRCKVPEGAVTGPISVFWGAQFVTSREDFVVIP